METILEQKKIIRDQIKRELKLLGAPEVARLSRTIRRRLIPVINGLKEKKESPVRVSAFAARPFEVDLLPLVALMPEVEWYFPRCIGPHDMEFRRVTNTSEQLLPGYKGIREPRPDAELIAPARLDLILSPGVAFTRSGKRLGFGKGFYDAVFAQSPDSLKIGVCFPCQLRSDIPLDSHDFILNVVVVAGEGRNIDLLEDSSLGQEFA